MKPIFTGMALLFMVSGFMAHADLVYTFNSDAEGFQNVSWQATAYPELGKHADCDADPYGRPVGRCR